MLCATENSLVFIYCHHFQKKIHSIRNILYGIHKSIPNSPKSVKSMP